MPNYLRAEDGTLYPYHERFSHMKPATQADIEAYFAVQVIQPAHEPEPEPEQAPVELPDRLILRDGTDITAMRAKAMREYARKTFEPDPAWPGNMHTDEIREALYLLDQSTEDAG